MRAYYADKNKCVTVQGQRFSVKAGSWLVILGNKVIQLTDKEFRLCFKELEGDLKQKPLDERVNTLKRRFNRGYCNGQV